MYEDWKGGCSIRAAAFRYLNFNYLWAVSLRMLIVSFMRKLSLLVAFLFTASLFAQSDALPDLHALLKRADDVSVGMDKRLADYEYSCVRISKEDKDDGPVYITSLFVGYSIRSVNVSRLLELKLFPLSQKQIKHQDKLMEKLVHERTEHPLKDKSSSLDMPYVEFERLGKFSNLHREIVNGRNTFVMAFDGDTHLKTKTIAELIATHLHLVLGIDEEDGAVSFVRGETTEDLHKFIFRLKKGFQMDITYQRLEPGLWVVYESWGAGSGKVLFIGIPLDVYEINTDFHRVLRSQEDRYAHMSLQTMNEDQQAKYAKLYRAARDKTNAVWGMPFLVKPKKK